MADAVMPPSGGTRVFSGAAMRKRQRELGTLDRDEAIRRIYQAGTEFLDGEEATATLEPQEEPSFYRPGAPSRSRPRAPAPPKTPPPGLKGPAPPKGPPPGYSARGPTPPTKPPPGNAGRLPTATAARVAATRPPRKKQEGPPEQLHTATGPKPPPGPPPKHVLQEETRKQKPNIAPTRPKTKPAGAAPRPQPIDQASEDWDDTIGSRIPPSKPARLQPTPKASLARQGSDSTRSAIPAARIPPGPKARPRTGPAAKARVPPAEPPQPRGVDPSQRSQAAPIQKRASETLREDVLWLRLQDGTPLAGGEHGELPSEAPAICFGDGIKDLLSETHHILNKLLGDPNDLKDVVSFLDDPEWNVFPEVGAAIKEAGGEVVSFCVAICESKHLFAVGLAGNWKRREQMAKLSMCVALALEQASAGASAAAFTPSFDRLCEAFAPVAHGALPPKRRRINPPSSNALASASAGRKAGASSASRNPVSAAGAGKKEAARQRIPEHQLQEKIQKLEKKLDNLRAVDDPDEDLEKIIARHETELAALQAEAAESAAPALVAEDASRSEQGLADQSGHMWLTLQEPPSLPEKHVLPLEGPALSYDEDIKGLAGNAHQLLVELLQTDDVDHEVQVHDDADWNQYPEIVAAIREAGGQEISYSVALCVSRGIWAVGVAGNWKKRVQVARLSMAVALKMSQGEGDGTIGDTSAWPEFTDLCESVSALHGRSYVDAPPDDDEPDDDEPSIREPRG